MYCHGDTTRMGNRWLETCECECLCDEVSLTPPHMLAHSYWLERCHSGGGYHYAGDCNNPGVPCSGTWRLNTKCTIPSCTTSQYLKGGSCAACPPSTGASSSHPSATSTGGSATFCTCPENYYAYAGMNAPSMYDWACQECPVGYSFIKNGSVIPTASGTSDTCDCKAGYYLDNSGLNCHMCDPGTTSAGSRVTDCDVTYCAVNQRVQDNECVTCPAGTSNADGGDDASGEDTSCSATKCGVDEYVSSNTCAACMGGSTKPEGDDASGDDTTCACASNERVQSNACVACDAGETNAAGNPVPGPDTACTKVVSPPPPPSPPIVAASPPPPLLSSESPPPPPSSVEGMVANAEAKTEVAEVSRDALLADISDESTRAKAKLLADTAIAGVKVKKVAMALTAETGDVACAQAFSKMQLDVSLGACDAAVSTSRRRRLVADIAYDVTVFMSPATVDETTLAVALESLAAAGVTVTSTETDPIEELRAIPGIDATGLDSFAVDAAVAAEATATAREAETTWVPPPPMPPPPEPPASPPPPVLVEDDSSAWRATVNALVLCAIAVVLTVMI